MNPKFCKHKKQFCFRRPDGPLKDIKDPALREKESRRLSRERREKTEREQTEAKTRVILGVTTAIEAIPAGNNTTKITPAKSGTAVLGVRNEDVPPNRYTESELRGTSWSTPTGIWENRYLISRYYNENPLTQDDLDLLIPEDVRDSDFLVNRVTRHFAEIGRGEPKVHCFLKDKQGYAKTYKDEHFEMFQQVRERRKELDKRRSRTTKMPQKANRARQTASG